MHTGMFWFDNDPKTTLTAKIQKAVDSYTKKYRVPPTVCLVNPSMLEPNQGNPRVGNLTIRSHRTMLPGHIWIGVEEIEPTIAVRQAAIKPI